MAGNHIFGSRAMDELGTGRAVGILPSTARPHLTTGSRRVTAIGSPSTTNLSVSCKASIHVPYTVSVPKARPDRVAWLLGPLAWQARSFSTGRVPVADPQPRLRGCRSPCSIPTRVGTFGRVARKHFFDRGLSDLWTGGV